MSSNKEPPRRLPDGGMPSPFDSPPSAAAPSSSPAEGGLDLLAAAAADRRADQAAADQARARAQQEAREARAVLLAQAAKAAQASAQPSATAAEIFPPLPPTLSPSPPPPATPAAEPLLDEATEATSARFELSDAQAPPAMGATEGTVASVPPLPPHVPWRGDVLPARRRQPLRQVALYGLALGLGALLGVQLAPEGPRELRLELAAANQELQADRQRISALEQTINDQLGVAGRGKLAPVDRARHEHALHRYMATLRRAQAQSAAELMQWFVGRWDQLLDFPQEDDRIGRRAAALSLLVGGMAENLNEGDFVPWQAEFLGGDWLGDLHFDMDGDGLPGKRAGANRHDGFANVSVCHIAMALNQSMTDGRILVRPDMRCDRPEARMSVFLQGKTFDDALTEFVRAVREQGFLVAERLERNTRLVLVGARPKAPAAY